MLSFVSTMLEIGSRCRTEKELTNH